MKLRFMVVGVLALVACKDKGKSEPPPGGSAVPAGSATSSAPPPAGSGSATTAGPAAPAASTTYCGATPCPCKPGSEQKRGDKLEICELDKAIKIGAHSCEPGRVVFHDEGALEECLLTTETQVGSYTCKPAPLSTAFHKDGTLRNCSVAKDATIGDFTITSGRGIKLYPDGKLRNGWTEKPVTVDGWACTRGTYLFADGKLEACTVDVAGKIGTQDIPAGSMIRIRKDGTLRGLELGAAATVGGKPAKAGDRFCFEDGKPEKSGACWAF